jgi:acetyl esterase/lipase
VDHAPSSRQKTCDFFQRDFASFFSFGAVAPSLRAMKPRLVPVVAFFMSLFLQAQETPIPLWPAGSVPGATGTGDNDAPTLTPYQAAGAKSKAPAMVILPGGGYGGLAQHEGHDFALYLNREGIRCFVVKYRLGSHGYRHPSMLNDAARAVRLVRSRAAEFGVDPDKIGIMGSSAGGHLASTLLTHHEPGKTDATDPVERVSSRPDLGILCYAVISMGPFSHAGSRKNLLGDNPAPELIEDLSNENRVTASTPPTFLWSLRDDAAVPIENSMAFATACRKAKVPFELHIYDGKPHGIGLGTKPPAFENPHPWTADLLAWLKIQGWR